MLPESASDLRWNRHGYTGFQAQGTRGLWLIFVTGARHTVWFQPEKCEGMVCVRNFTDEESAKNYCADKERGCRTGTAQGSRRAIVVRYSRAKP